MVKFHRRFVTYRFDSFVFVENIMWLTVDNIQEKDETEISEPSEVPNMVGSGVSVGAVVSDTVGASNASQVTQILLISTFICVVFSANDFN